MAEANLQKKVVNNVFWAIAGKMVNLLSGLVVGIIVARYLGPEQYGLMNYVISYVFLFQVLSVVGLDSIEVRELSKNNLPKEVVLGSAFALRIVFAVVGMGLVVGTSYVMDADAFTTLLVAVYALTIPLNTLSVIRNYFTAIVQNEYVVKVEMARSLIGIVIKLVLLWLDSTLIWFVVFSMFDYVLTSGGYISAYRAKAGALRDWRFSADCCRMLLFESFPLLLTNVAVILYQRIDQVMIKQMIDNESVGYFSVASRFVEVLIYIPMVLSQTIMPVLVTERKKGEASYEKSAQRFMDISLWLSLLASAGTSVIAYWLVVLLYGEAYLPAVVVLQIMAFKAASVALSNTAGAMLVAEGLQKYAILRDGLGCITCVVLNYLLLPHYGIVAAAFVAIASNLMAGYVADAFIPAYRHLFVRQNKAILLGWRSLPEAWQMVANKRSK